MKAEPYSKREVDLIIEKMALHHETTTAWLRQIDTKVEYTNGKVKRLVLAVVGIACVLIGFGFKTAMPLILAALL